MLLLDLKLKLTEDLWVPSKRAVGKRRHHNLLDFKIKSKCNALTGYYQTVSFFFLLFYILSSNRGEYQGLLQFLFTSCVYLKWQRQTFQNILPVTPSYLCLSERQKQMFRVICFCPFPIKIKHRTIWSKWNRWLVHFCLSLCLWTCVRTIWNVCEHMFMHACQLNTVCMCGVCVLACIGVCVCVLESHLDWLRHLLHHTSGAWCDIWGIYCILPCNITHNLLLKVIMYPLIHF